MGVANLAETTFEQKKLTFRDQECRFMMKKPRRQCVQLESSSRREFPEMRITRTSAYAMSEICEQLRSRIRDTEAWRPDISQQTYEQSTTLRDEIRGRELSFLMTTIEQRPPEVIKGACNIIDNTRTYLAGFEEIRLWSSIKAFAVDSPCPKYVLVVRLKNSSQKTIKATNKKLFQCFAQH